MRIYTILGIWVSVSVSVVSVVVSASSSLSSSFASPLVVSVVSSLLSLVASLLSSLFSFLFSLGPGFLVEELSVQVLEGSLVSGGLLLLSSWLSGEGDLYDGEESFLLDLEESLLSGHENINDFLFGDGDDLVKVGNFPSEDFGDP